MAQKPAKKAKQGMGLHHFIATGGKPADYEACKGVNSTTIPGYTEKGEKYK